MHKVEAETVFRVSSTISASIILLLGIVVVTGFMIPSTVSSNYRMALGTLMIIYAIYRIVTILRKQRNTRRSY